MAQKYATIYTYRGTHGNLRLGKSCKTPILRRRRGGCRTKNPLHLGIGSVNAGNNEFRLHGGAELDLSFDEGEDSSVALHSGLSELEVGISMANN